MYKNKIIYFIVALCDPKHVLHGSYVLGLAEVVGLAAGFLLHVVVARSLDPADYGRFALLIVTEVGLLTVATGGVPHALRRLVGADIGNLDEACRWAMMAQFPLGVGLGLILFLGAGPIGALLGDAGLVVPLRLLALDVAIRCGLMESHLALLNGARCYLEQGCVVAIFFLARLACVTLLVALSGSLAWAVLGIIVASTTATVLSASFIRGLRGRVSCEPGANLAAEVMAWVGLGPGYEALFALVIPANLWLVKAGVPDPTLAGWYAAGLVTAQAMSALGRALVGGTYAPLARAFADQDPAGARRSVSLAAGVMAGLFLPTCAFAAVRGEGVLGLLYGLHYRGSAHLLGILFAGASGLVALSFYGAVLGAAGLLGTRLRLVGCLAPGSILVTLVLIGLAGPAGAAWALLLTGISGAVASAWLVARAVGPCIPWRALFRASLAATVMALGLLLFDPVRGVAGLVLDLGIAFACYPTALLFFSKFGGWPVHPPGALHRLSPETSSMDTGARP